jgi:hypothetical protein
MNGKQSLFIEKTIQNKQDNCYACSNLKFGLLHAGISTVNFSSLQLSIIKTTHSHHKQSKSTKYLFDTHTTKIISKRINKLNQYNITILKVK